VSRRYTRSLIRVEYYQSVRKTEQQQLVRLEILTKNVKVGAVPFTGLERPRGFQDAISRHSTHEAGKVVRPTHRPPLPPRKYSWHSFLRRLCRSQSHRIMSKKNSNESPVIEPATFRLVAQCPTQLRHGVPRRNI
jgi:hypothetical protein